MSPAFIKQMGYYRWNTEV